MEKVRTWKAQKQQRQKERGIAQQAAWAEGVRKEQETIDFISTEASLAQSRVRTGLTQRKHDGGDIDVINDDASTEAGSEIDSDDYDIVDSKVLRAEMDDLYDRYDLVLSITKGARENGQSHFA